MATLKYWNGASWVATNIGAEVYTQSAPPATTTVGALWIDTDELPPVWSSYFVNQIYAITGGYAADRALNPQVSTINEVAAVLATLIDDLKAAGILKTS